jgi:hypothetical protein
MIQEALLNKHSSLKRQLTTEGTSILSAGRPTGRIVLPETTGSSVSWRIVFSQLSLTSLRFYLPRIPRSFMNMKVDFPAS